METKQQLLFYERAVPVTHERHKDWFVETGHTYAFARHANSVPVMASEFAKAGLEYPIVFGGEGDASLPMAVLGARDRQNVFITETGGWDAEYIPAFVRRYPFVFAATDGGKNFTLCIDERFVGCNTDGRGQRLFDEEGNRTPFVENVLRFLSEFERQYRHTRLLTQRLTQLELLEPMQASVSLDSGERLSLTGFRVVSRERLKALAPERLAELARADLLELVYTHVHSLANFAKLVGRVARTNAVA